MWFDLANWDAATGPLYMGANTSWEVIWTILAAVLCIWAIVMGSRHELDAYEKMKNKKNGS